MCIYIHTTWSHLHICILTFSNCLSVLTYSYTQNLLSIPIYTCTHVYMYIYIHNAHTRPNCRGNMVRITTTIKLTVRMLLLILILIHRLMLIRPKVTLPPLSMLVLMRARVRIRQQLLPPPTPPQQQQPLYYE